MKKQLKKYDITQCRLYKCGSKRKLGEILNIDWIDLKNIIRQESYYEFNIPKKDGDLREILAPKEKLKIIQRRILKLLQPIQRPEWLISGEVGKSYINNGYYHLNAKYMLAVDIKKFYNNCVREYTFRFYRDKLCVPSDVAKVLSDITTHKRIIPTGCPTSQMIAYYAYEDMFNEIKEISEKYNCKYSVYVDDMTFSSQSVFNHRKLASEVDQVLRKYGHKVKPSKVKFYGSKKHKPVTGTSIGTDNKLYASNKLQEKIYKEFQEIKNSDNIEIRQIQSLVGKIQSVRNIEAERFPEISRCVKAIDL